MASERHFETAAERRTMNSGDYRLLARFDYIDHFREPRFHRRLAELGDIGASEKCSALTPDNNGLYVTIARSFLNCRHKPRPHRVTQRIYRRIV